MSAGYLRVPAIETHPSLGGVIGVAGHYGRLHDVDDPHLGAGIEFELGLCSPPGLAPGMCDDFLGAVVDTEKTVSPPKFDTSPAFAVYKAVECMPDQSDRYETMARQTLMYGADVAVERAFQVLNLDSVAVSQAGPGQGYSLKEAIAVAEQAIALNHPGHGAITTSRYGASWLSTSRQVDSLVADSGRTLPENVDEYLLITKLGTPIVGGGGINKTTAIHALAKPGNFVIWVTSSYDVYRGPVIYNEGYDTTLNKHTGIAEQVYAVSFPCYQYALEVDPTA